MRWKRKGKIPFPAIEAANISKADLPTEERIDFWVKTAIGVKDDPSCIFIKVHTHGALEQNYDVLLGEQGYRMHKILQEKYNDGKNYRLHYVSARQLYNIVKALEQGEKGNAYDYRDYLIDKPRYLS